MTPAGVAEVVRAVQPPYLRAKRKDKTRILDELVPVTGYHRKEASSSYGYDQAGDAPQGPHPYVRGLGRRGGG